MCFSCFFIANWLPIERPFLSLRSVCACLQCRCPSSDWAVNIHRDSYASYIGHSNMLAYFAVAENESIGRERYNFMQVSG